MLHFLFALVSILFCISCLYNNFFFKPYVKQISYTNPNQYLKKKKKKITFHRKWRKAKEKNVRKLYQERRIKNNLISLSSS